MYDEVFAYTDVCEIRLSSGTPARVLAAGRTHIVGDVVSQRLLDEMLAVATDYSVYTAVPKMTHGFLPYRGGVRIGLAGTYCVQGGALHSLQRLTGMVIRLPRAVRGCSDVLPLETVLGHNVLVVAPPYGGKTTFLRDLAARVSRARRVVAVDERGELSGEGALDVGECMVVSGAPKALVCESIVRALNPQVVALDELGAEDAPSVRALGHSGVDVLATVHGDNLRPTDKPWDIFDVRVLLSPVPTPGRVAEVRHA